MSENSSCGAPVRLHFANNFPIETRCATEDDEFAVVEILKVEYDLEENGDNFDMTLFFSGIKAFSVSDDDQECYIAWKLTDFVTGNTVAEGKAGTGTLEMGERFLERQSLVRDIARGDYVLNILYV